MSEIKSETSTTVSKNPPPINIEDSSPLNPWVAYFLGFFTIILILLFAYIFSQYNTTFQAWVQNAFCRNCSSTSSNTNSS